MDQYYSRVCGYKLSFGPRKSYIELFVQYQRSIEYLAVLSLEALD